jgi:hypothetical protein
MELTPNRLMADGSYALPGVGAFLMADTAAPIVLNANQRRHFEVLFARFEDTLVEIDWLLTHQANDARTLTLYHDDLPRTFRKKAPAAIRHLREMIGTLSTTLDLRPRTQSRRRAIAALLTSQAVRIEDSLAPQMRGYGEIDVSASQRLDPQLRTMITQLGQLTTYLAARDDGGDGP